VIEQRDDFIIKMKVVDGQHDVKVTRGGRNVALSPRFWENFGK
jgi:hypothetical protein